MNAYELLKNNKISISKKKDFKKVLFFILHPVKLQKFHIIFFLVLTYQSISGQIYNFKNYNSENGITNTTVLDITQLSNGEIWIGTNEGGINIFDGNSFKAITKENGLVDNVIYDFLHDKKGNIWISTNNGVNVYNGKTFDSIPCIDTLVHSRVFKTFIDSKNNVWFCTGEGLATLENNQMVKYKSGNDLLDKTPIIYGCEDNKGNIWLGSMGESAFKISSDGEIKQFSSGKSLKYTFSIFHPDDNTTWFLSFKGLFELKGDTITEKVFDSFSNFKGSTYFHHCYEDNEGNYWFATKKRGVLKVSGDQEKLFTVNNGMGDEDYWRIFQDREHNMWFGGQTKGLCMLPNETFDLTNSQFGLPSDYVLSIFTDSKSQIWVGTKKGIYKKGNDSNIQIIDPNGQNKNIIECIDEAENGDIHIVMKSGVKIISNNETKTYHLNSEEQFFRGYCMLIDGNDVVYGGANGVGILQGGYIKLINDSINLPVTPVLDIEKDHQGVYWFATDRGLISYDGTSSTFYNESHGIPNIKIRTIIKDESNNLWIGSSEGIYIYSKGQFTHLSEDNGLSSNTIYSLCFDNDGQLWIGQPNGVDKIILDKFKIREVRHYDEGKGFLANFCNNNAITLDPKGRVLIGTDKGFLTYNKEFDQFNFLESMTVITDIKLFSQPTDWNLFSDKLDERGYPIGIELGYNQNYFTFDFTGICLKNPAAVKYKYMLEGLDQDWILTETKKNAAYSSLLPGDYTFKVISSNDEGIWNKKPVTFSFVILPPFWQTWWFYSICFIAFVFAVYSYLKIRASNKIIRKANDRVTQQSQIIEEKNHEIVDSINYAKRIQEAILPKNHLKEDLANCFVFYKPKDIVSGDFFWYKKADNKYLIASVDCTGHGVPGGFMSMVGHSGLNRAVNEYNLRKPSEILEQLSEFVIESFDDDEGEGAIKDGMDAALCSIDLENSIVEYSGANNPLYIIKKNNNGSLEKDNAGTKFKQLDNLFEIKGDRRPVGPSENKEHFTNYKLQLEKGDCIYFFTDGFPDQFGGPKGKKYMYKSFKRYLISISNLPVEEQQNKLEKEFSRWQGNHEQVDDICVIGVRF